MTFRSLKAPQIQRKTCLLREDRVEEQPKQKEVFSPDDECTVLVVNSSQDMAKEITMQLSLSMPACSIMYAPSIELAVWILRKRKIALVVASSILPDGNVTRLKEVLEKMKYPPPLVVVGDITVRNAEELASSLYKFSSVRLLGRKERAASPAPEKRISSLGANLRDKLNNPLQEIVAMVFVAQNGSAPSPVAEGALEAIDRAAKNMSQVVNRLEDDIRSAMSSRPYVRR